MPKLAAIPRACATAAAAAGLLLAGCGGSSQPKTPTAAKPPALVATFRGENHAPRVGKPWHYTVTAKTRNGGPASAAVHLVFVVGGAVVGRDASGTHHFKGRYTGSVTFPPRSAGYKVTVRAIVSGAGTTRKLDWPVKARR